MRFDDHLTDDALLAELGGRLARTRLELDLTQQQLADRSGVSRRTVVQAESGRSVNSVGLVRILRALGLASNLEALVPEPTPSPLVRTARDTRRRRASGRERAAGKSAPGTVHWGDGTEAPR